MGFAGLRTAFPARVFASDGPGARTGIGFGPMVRDPKGMLDLPAGFSYRVFSRAGTEMSDGLLVPGKHDGMAAFRGESGRVILVRNHEMEVPWVDLSPFGPRNELVHRFDRSLMFDPRPSLGGVTRVEFDEDSGTVVREHLALAGTQRNCAGGPTPWGSWISCEEDVTRKGNGYEQDHGWCFEVPARMDGGPVRATALRAMGRFYHEAVAIDPRSGVVYLTEDRDDALIYRFIPNVPGALAEGGRLQAMAIVGRPSIDTRNWTKAQGGTGVREVNVGTRLHVEWLDIDEVDTPDDSLRSRMFKAGAARFARGEGAWFGNDAVYIACTSGGMHQLGQVWRYVPSSAEATVDEARNRGSIELWVESEDGSILKNCDNLTVAPWGDVVVCEDGEGGDRVMGITPSGEVYPIASNVGSDSEVAGVCFSPSGRTLFFNLQNQAISIAVQGPWPSV